MTLDILRRTGGWCVELRQPLKHHSGDITAIEIRPPTADIVIRWASYEIGSVLALLSRLCDLPERLLRQLPQSEFDRVMAGFLHAVGPQIKQEIEEGKRLFATAEEDLPPEEKMPLLDQQDPRFPAVEGPVVRLAEKKPPPPLAAEDAPINFGPPPVSEVVNG